MKRHIRAYIALAMAVIMMWPIRILANSADHLVISEIQTASVNDSSQEFIEIYNPTASPWSVTGWTLEYASAAGTTWTKKATLSGIINPYGFYLVATSGYSAADATLTSGLAATSGHVRIKDTGGAVADVVGWGAAAHAESYPIEAPAAGGSIERLPGRLNELAGNGEDTDSNKIDFVQRTQAQPQTTASATEDPALAPEPVEETPPIEEVPTFPLTYLQVQITELFPDPASPLTDAHDEYIEIYNPNSESVNLAGYVLRTGTNFRSYYTIGDIVIAPGGYLALYSSETKLGLPNGGGAAQVLDPLGNILHVSGAYGTAKAGQTWADINGVWAWTLEPTGGKANILTEPAPKVVTATKAKATKKTTTKKAAAKKTTTKKAAAKKTKATKMPKTGIAAATTAITQPSSVARWLLIAAGCFTIVYAIYGFRHDIHQYYIRGKSYVAARVPSGRIVSWRRNSRTR